MLRGNAAEASVPKPGTTQHPLGPLVYRVESRRPSRAKWRAAVVFCGALTLLGIAAWLTPDPSGLGSHRQLGLPACSVVTIVGYPCPTCGMTTAFAHTVRGELPAAFQAQPAGLILALGTILAGILSLNVLLTGQVWAVNWYRISPTKVAVSAIVLLLVGWAYKIIFGVVQGVYPLGR